MYLQNINSLHPFIWDDSIAKAAADHANDIGPKGNELFNKKKLKL